MVSIGVPAEGPDEARIGITPETVKKLIKAGAEVKVCTGAGPRDVTKLKFGSWGVPLLRVAAHCAQVPIAEYGITIVTRRFVRYCNRRGVAVHVWTINDEAEMRRLIRLGVNGLMTDRPTLLKKVAMEEGVW